MKDKKLAKRRHDLWKKVRQRTKTWGFYQVWMKHTSRPCNCWMCTMDKYNRTQSQYIQKDINEQIEDYGLNGYNEETHICEKGTPKDDKTDLS